MSHPFRRPTRGFMAVVALGALAVSTLALGSASVAVAASGSTSTAASAASASADASQTAPASASAATSGEAAGEATADRSSFLLPVLPDTQFYSRYSASQFVPQYGTNPFEVQTQWIVDNKKTLNIPFAMQVGDVVDQQWVGDQWTAATKAMKTLEDGGVPYSILPGNHDVNDQGARSWEGNAANYLANFGASALQRQGGGTLLGTYQNGYSSAYRFEAEGRQWIALAIGWNASDDTFAWAQGILDAHPGVPTILTSHAIIGIDQDQISPTSWWYGELLWDRLVRQNDQIVLTVNGHFHGATMRTVTNDFGHPVYEVLTDYQMAADGGNGIMTLFEFDLTNNRIDVETVSPWVPKKHRNSLTSTDTPVLSNPRQSYSLDLDFGARFGWGAPEAAQVDNGDLSARAKQIVSEGWTGTGGGQKLEAAGDASDYVAVPGTIAHWRFGDVAEGAVTDTTEIPDVAGASPMYRNPLADTDAADKAEDVSVTHSNVPFYSSDRGSVCFTDVRRNANAPDNLSYITTEYGAPATFARLDASTGYTLETFLQMDEGWTEAANRWGAAITRGGARQWMGINDSSDPGAGAAWLGISSLREYQFSAADTASKNSYTLWSGEIMPGSWHHVAIVNDPAASTVIMYVDGVPVLRNASKVGGLMAADFMPWIIGTSTWNTEPQHGWYGCVGETRIVDHALTASEFLYQRQNIDGDGGSFALATDVSGVKASGASFSSFEGSGLAGASVRVLQGGQKIGEARVAADGTWRIALQTPVAGVGTHALSFVQSIGSRDGAAYDAAVVIGVDEAWSPAPEALTDEAAGGVVVAPSTVQAGEAVTVTLPAGYEGTQVYGFVFSSPAPLGSATVSGNAVSFTLPRGLAAPAQHRVAVYTAGGQLIGWQAVTVTPVPDTTGTPGTPDAGGANGTDAAVSGGDGVLAQAPADSRAAAEQLARTGVASGALGVLAAIGAVVTVLGTVVLLRRQRRA